MPRIRCTSFIRLGRPENRKGFCIRRAAIRADVPDEQVIFDLRENDVYWCTADIGWVTGHSYVVYGALQNGVTTLMYEGALNCPRTDRTWQIIADHKVTVFYTAPTAIRAFIKWGQDLPEKHDLSSLRLLGTVGEPINPQAWMLVSRGDWQGAVSDC